MSAPQSLSTCLTQTQHTHTLVFVLLQWERMRPLEGPVLWGWVGSRRGPIRGQDDVTKRWVLRGESGVFNLCNWDDSRCDGNRMQPCILCVINYPVEKERTREGRWLKSSVSSTGQPILMHANTPPQIILPPKKYGPLSTHIFATSSWPRIGPRLLRLTGRGPPTASSLSRCNNTITSLNVVFVWGAYRNFKEQR